MAQLVTRIDAALEAAIDQLVADGAVDSRSDAVRRGLLQLVENHRRAQIGARIVAGYQARPQGDDECGWSDQATVEMITEEPW